MKFYIALLLCGFSAALKKENEKVQLVAEFNGKKIRGSILFTQEDMENVTISFKDLTISLGSKIAIHKFPVKYVGLPNESCSTNNIGDIFYPENCPENISKCYFDDLSKNPKVMVSGKNSIFGRSIAIHDKNDNILACSTIKSKKSHSLFLVGVFQSTLNGIAGTIVLGQPASNPAADTMVDINLQLVDPRSEPLTGLSFGVYVSTTSSKVEGSCKGLKNMFNPFGKTSCDQRRHSTCAIGDLSGKLGYLDVPLPGGKNQYQFFIDSNLPLSGENSVMGNSLVIMQNGQLLICAKLQEFQEMMTEVTLGETGIVRFNQGSFYSPPIVNVSLGNEYDDVSVYELAPIPPACDKSKLGDKIISFSNEGPVDELTLYGRHSMLFRGLVISENVLSKKMICKQLLPKNPKYLLKAKTIFNETSINGIVGSVNFEQALMNEVKAFAYSASIVMSLSYNNDTKITKHHNWHIHIAAVGNDSNMKIGKKCMSCLGHYNPYNVYFPENDYAATCNPGNPFRCELGDVSSKLGTYDVGGGMKHFTETENYFASWHNIIGRALVVHAPNKGAPRQACSDVMPGSGFTVESLLVKNSKAARNIESFQNVVAAVLKIDTWRVADVKYEPTEGDSGCLTYHFVLIEDTESDLHQAFGNVVNDNRNGLKDFASSCAKKPRWKISKGNAAEIIGVVFGILILLVFILCMFLWLRKRRQENETSTKLFDNTVANETAVNVDK